jgi:hypothetical protein
LSAVDLLRNTVRFHLTAKGRSEFGRIVAKSGSFQAVVLGSDAAGAWVLFPGLKEIPSGGTVPVMLVKWEYVSTAVFELQPEEVPPRREMGFVPNR